MLFDQGLQIILHDFCFSLIGSVTVCQTEDVFQKLLILGRGQ